MGPIGSAGLSTFVLASASPARRAVLRAAGIDPVVHVSAVDEDALLAGLGAVAPEIAVSALAQAKAHDVADAHRFDDAVVVGCDSMLHVGGALVGKPHTIEVARARWSDMAGEHR